MRAAVLTLLAALAFAGGARAEPVSLTVDDAYQVQAALKAISQGAVKKIKDGERESGFNEPFKLSDKVRIAVGKDLARIQTALAPFEAEVRQVREAICGAGKCSEEAETKLHVEVAAMAAKAKRLDLDLIPLTEPELQLPDNPGITPQTLQALAPIAAFMR